MSLQLHCQAARRSLAAMLPCPAQLACTSGTEWCAQSCETVFLALMLHRHPALLRTLTINVQSSLSHLPCAAPLWLVCGLLVPLTHSLPDVHKPSHNLLPPCQNPAGGLGSNSLNAATSERHQLSCKLVLTCSSAGRCTVAFHGSSGGSRWPTACRRRSLRRRPAD